MWFHSYPIYSHVSFPEKSTNRKAENLQDDCTDLSFLSPFRLDFFLPFCTKTQQFLKLVQYKKWIFSQGSCILKNIGCQCPFKPSHTDCWQHKMKQQYILF